MEFPPEILSIIKEYSRPIGTRSDWRMGCYINRNWVDNGFYYESYSFGATILLIKQINDFRYNYHHIELFEMIL
jgi:hypothetical protein